MAFQYDIHTQLSKYTLFKKGILFTRNEHFLNLTERVLTIS